MRSRLRSLTAPALPLLSLCLCLPLGACEDESDPTFSDVAATPYGVSACDMPDGRLAARRQLRLFANQGLDPSATVAGLARYYRRHGLTFQTTGSFETTDLAFVQDLDNAKLSAKLRQDFPGVDLSDAGLTKLSRDNRPLFDQIAGAILRFQFSGMLGFLDKYQLRGQGVTNVVLLNNLVTPGSPKDTREGILGIAISPFLLTELARTGMDAQRTIPAAGFDPDFAPLVFIGESNVKRLENYGGAVQRDLVVSHEFGHSAGLVHRMDGSNLMNPSTDGKETCALTLSAEQIGVMQQGLGLTARTSQAMSLRVADEPRPLSEVFPPSLLAGIVRGDPEAQRALLEPFQGHAH